MKIQTFSIVAGTEACNARCPFCVSKMTPPQGVELSPAPVNWRNFHIACNLARQQGVTTAMITGKGEPTLFKHQISDFLSQLAEYRFPFVELQTNGIPIADDLEAGRAEYLGEWYSAGLTTVIVSVVHYEARSNREIYLPYREHYIDLRALVSSLREVGFMVRLNVTLIKGYIDSIKEVENMAAYGRRIGANQVTLRPVAVTDTSRSFEVARWTKEHKLDSRTIKEIALFLETNATSLLDLMHGAKVYDYQGQNVCLSNALTHTPDPEQVRQLIFFPDGTIAYDWSHEGAILLAGRRRYEETQSDTRRLHVLQQGSPLAD